jgi:glycosyltransferase involved in cell wall biosynthesis
VVHITTTDMSLDWLLGPQLRAFAAAGYEVIGMSAAGEHVANLDGDGHRTRRRAGVHPLEQSAPRPAGVRPARAAAAELRPDIVHTHNPKPGILGRIAARLTRTPLVVNTQHGLWAQPTDRWQRRLPVYAAERIAAAFGDVELVQNPEDVATLVDTLHIPARKVRLLGNGVDLERFDPDARSGPTSAPGCAREWGIADGEVLCLVVGRLVREKGIVELLEAAHDLHERGVPCGSWWSARPIPTRATPSSHVFDRAAADGVVFTGTRTDMPECYAAADLFLTASWREGFPRSAMEAAAMGLADGRHRHPRQPSGDRRRRDRAARPRARPRRHRRCGRAARRRRRLRSRWVLPPGDAPWPSSTSN